MRFSLANGVDIRPVLVITMSLDHNDHHKNDDDDDDNDDEDDVLVLYTTDIS